MRLVVLEAVDREFQTMSDLTLSKAATNEALLCISILKRIPRNRWISTSEILSSLAEDGIKLSVRRLQRYLKAICDNPDFKIEVRDNTKPYVYRQRVAESELAVSRLQPQESVLIRLAEEHLVNMLPPRLSLTLKPLFMAARHALAEENAGGSASAWLKKVAIVPDSIPRCPPKLTTRIFGAVCDGLYCDARLSVDYVNSEGKTTSAEVNPLGLVQQGQRLYLVCQFEGYDDIRHLALHRIRSVKQLDVPAVRPKGFALDRYVKGRHFNYSNGQKVHLALEFSSPVTAKNLRESPFTKEQTLEELEDGFWRLEADVDDSILLDGWIATWSEKAGIRLVERTPVAEEPAGAEEPEETEEAEEAGAAPESGPEAAAQLKDE